MSGIGRYVYIAVPSKTGMVPIEAQQSYFDFMVGCNAVGAQMSMATIKFNPYIQHTRNRFVARFLESECSELLMVDDDLAWDAGSVEKILRPDVDVIGGVYPYKNDKRRWPAMNAGPPRADGLVPMVYVPTGFLRMSRRCLEAMVQTYADLEYVERSAAPDASVNEVTRQHALFWVDCIRDENGLAHFQGEDLNFCMKWRAMGGEIWCDPTIKFRHFGMKDWHGCYADYLVQQREAAE